MIRFRFVSVLCLFASSVFAAEPVRVNPLPKRESARPAIAAPGEPDAAKVRAAILRAVPGRATASRVSSNAVEPRATEYAVSYRANGTPRQIRPIQQPREAVGTEAFSADPLDSARAFLRANRGLLRLQDPDAELVVANRQEDVLGGTDIRFRQEWEGIPVWPAEVIVHLDAKGAVELVEGAYIPSPRRMLKKPVVDAKEALAGLEGEASTPQLIVHSRNGRRPRLAWKTTVSEALDRQWVVVIDAMTGAVLQRYNNVQHAAVTGSGVDLSGTTRTLRLWQEGANYFMLDTSKQMFDPSSAPPNPNSVRGGIFVSDFSHGDRTFSLVNSTNANAWNVRDAVSAAFWLGQTYDYFLEHHGRDSIDGNKGTLTAAVRFKNNYPNAFWLDEQQLMVFGDGQTYAASLDVIAHEMAHGVTSHTANLVYEGQSGALNEAMSDIFGEMAEADFYGANDWLMGSHIGGAIRSMSNPGAFGDPAKMSQFVHTTDDNGGVHTNSGIINRAFYLLAQGMSGAIGSRDAERIFYRALTQHLTKDSQFIDARIAAITSANELFGASSNQARKTAEAFDLVEIFAASETPDEPTIPVVTGADAMLFIYRDADDWFLGRRETSDPQEGVQLATLPVAETRPAVSGDGSLGVFVDQDQDACLVNTSNGTVACLDLPSDGLFVSSVGVSPDKARFGFVLLGPDGDPENRIIVVDITTDETATYDLSAPVFDGESLANVEYADLMTFTADGQYLVYDALNIVETPQGDYSAWSIYALDLATEQVFSVIPVIEGLDVGYPNLGHTSDDLITFEAYDSSDDSVTVYAADLRSGEVRLVGADRSLPTSPSFTGDDRAIVYAVSSNSSDTGADLVRQNLAADHITPTGGRTLWLDAAAYGWMYRRGTYSGPTTNPGRIAFASAAYNVTEGSTATVTVIRSGGNQGAVSISFATQNGTAAAGSDYNAASGTLSWADGEDGAKTFLVHAAADSANESTETVTLRLTGANLGTQATSTLSITNQAPKAGRRRAVRH